MKNLLLVVALTLAPFVTRADDDDDKPNAPVTVVAGSEASLPRGKSLRFEEGAHTGFEDTKANKKLVIGIGKLLNVKRMDGCSSGDEVTVHWNVLRIPDDNKIDKVLTGGLASLGEGVFISARFRDATGREVLQVVSRGNIRWGTGFIGGGVNKAAKRAAAALTDFAARVCNSAPAEAAPVALQSVPTPDLPGPASSVQTTTHPVPVLTSVPVATQAAPNPPTAPVPLAKADVAERLQKLNELHTKGLITEQEYQTKRREVLDGL